MSFHLFDSVKKQKLAFKPQVEGKAKVYVCGPTVYDDAHLGHARSAVAFDLLHRVLKANGYDVTFAKNFTDVDDKIIKKMAESGKSLESITQHYIKSYQADMDSLNILPNTIEPKATQNLEAMKSLIQKLLDEDKAYILEDGVYLDTSKDINYGNISNRASDENSQARVETTVTKKDDKDFALWKFNINEISFEANFTCKQDSLPVVVHGSGRPGWHCECSAMINKHLADHSLPYAIDIHGGGADLLFPHHENEAAQTRMAYKQELAKYWMHNGFVNIDGEKMSKSLGNSFFLKDVLKNYNGEVIRFYLLTAHYRTDFGFNEEDLSGSKKRLDKLYRLKKRLYGGGSSAVNKEFKASILEALNDDLNTSKALAVIDEFIVNTNETLDKEPKNKALKKETIANIQFLNEILGIGYQDAYSYFQFGIDENEKKNIKDLISKRDEAKKEKNFELSDKIRDELTSLGISIMDTPNGTMWEKK
jgi:cysteinyl-tRNA synthetase